MNVVITGTPSFAKYPNLALAKFRKNPVAATTAISKFEEQYEKLSSILSTFQESATIKKIYSLSREGLEQAVERWASEAKIGVKRFKPNWKESGSRALYEKWVEMCEDADAALVILDGPADAACKGVIYEMRKAGKPVRVIDLYFT
jgi:hypothetical protein